VEYFPHVAFSCDVLLQQERKHKFLQSTNGGLELAGVLQKLLDSLQGPGTLFFTGLT
jgi:hypothetical protein